MRKLLKSCAIAAVIAGALVPAAHAGFVTQVIRFNFDDLQSNDYTFNTADPKYLTVQNSNVGITLTSSSTNKPHALLFDSASRAPEQPIDHSGSKWTSPPPLPTPPAATTNGPVALIFFKDLTITALANNPADPNNPLQAAIATVEFWVDGITLEFRPEGNTGGGQLPCPQGWCDMGPFNMAAADSPIALGDYKGVRSTTLSAAEYGVIDDLIITLVYEEAGGGSIPEPGSIGLVLAALGSVVATRRRQRT